MTDAITTTLRHAADTMLDLADGLGIEHHTTDGRVTLDLPVAILRQIEIADGWLQDGDDENSFSRIAPGAWASPYRNHIDDREIARILDSSPHRWTGIRLWACDDPRDERTHALRTLIAWASAAYGPDAIHAV